MPTFQSDRLEVFSPLAADECVSRLEAAMDKESSGLFRWDAFGSKPVIGTVSGDSLSLRKRIFYRNSFQTSLSAKIRPERGGTVISGEMGMDTLVRAFLVIWFGGVILIGGSMSVSSVSDLLSGSPRPGNNIVGAVVPLLMAGFGVGLSWASCLIERRH